MASFDGGPYTFGASPTCPQAGETVTLEPFLIDVTEVSNASYAAFLAATDHPAPRVWGRTDQPGEDALDRVSEGITAHRPKDRAGQSNATGRWRRVVLTRPK